MFSTIKNHRRAFRSLVMATLAVFALTACVQTAHKTTGTLKAGTENRRIVLMPVDIELSVLNAGGVTEPRADWTTAGRGHVRTALAAHTSAFEAEIVLPENNDILDDLDEDQLQIVKLANAVGSSILLHEYLPQMKLPTKNDQFDWTIGPDAKLLKEKYDADYALFVFLRDSYASSGRVAVIIIGAIFGVGLQGGVQAGTATLVDLETGQVVWFNRLARASGDLRNADAAVETIKLLLTEFPT
ncbi:MAG: hypothetical protein ABJ215_00990 [Alphaproteobacteria bacterium]